VSGSHSSLLHSIRKSRGGTHPAGRSSLDWNLRVNGRLLPAGSYRVSLHALNGNILSVPADPGVRTLVLATGRIRVEK
jgi:hypothetical protein